MRWIDLYSRLRVARKALADARAVINVCTFTIEYLKGVYGTDLMQGTGD